MALILSSSLSIPASEELGASLRLEGWMALRRGLETLLATQEENGAWEKDAVATSQAVMAIMMSGLAPEWPALQAAQQRGLEWLRQWLQDEASTARKASGPGTVLAPLIAVRPLLRLDDGRQEWRPTAAVWLRLDCEKLASEEWPWVLEAALLTGQAAPGITPSKKLSKSSSDDAPAHRLAAALLAGRLGAEVEALSAVARQSDWARENAAGWYWLARSGRILEQQSAGDLGAWRDRLLAVLLSRQRGDGLWEEKDGSVSGRVWASALALQAMILCLA